MLLSLNSSTILAVCWTSLFRCPFSKSTACSIAASCFEASSAPCFSLNSAASVSLHLFPSHISLNRPGYRKVASLLYCYPKLYLVGCLPRGPKNQGFAPYFPTASCNRLAKQTRACEQLSGLTNTWGGVKQQPNFLDLIAGIAVFKKYCIKT